MALPRSAAALASVAVLCAATVHLLAQDGASSPSAPAILRVQLDSPAKVRLGSVVFAHTVESLYQSNQLIVPAGARLAGKITQITTSPRMKRLAAASRGDFSPMHEASLQFDELVLPNGRDLPLNTAPAEASKAVVRFRSANTKRFSFFRRVWADVIDEKNSAVNTVTAPDKLGRFKRYLSGQLPWLPESLSAGAQYDVVLLKSPEVSAPEAVPLLCTERSDAGRSAKDPLTVHARLQTNLNSGTAKESEEVSAVVTEPVFDSRGQIEIPQGALLQGNVLRVRKARIFGRDGALRFSFTRISFPGRPAQNVRGTPTAMDAHAGQTLKVDAEGGVEPDSHRAILAPLAMGLLAASALHEDEASLGHAATASNGFGLPVRLVAIATGSKTFGGVMGGITAGRTLYSRFLAHGHDVSFPPNSEIEIQLDRHDAAHVMHP